MAFLYVPGLEGSSSALNSQSLDTDVWVTVSGTPTQRPLSWRGWKTRPWIKRLSTTISQPSRASSIAAAWISSLPDSRASRSPSPASARAPTTPAGSGPISPESLTRYDPDTCSWKTSQACLPILADSERSSVIWPKAGSMRSGTCSARPDWGRHTFGNGCLSWATARATDWKGEQPDPEKAKAKGKRSLSLDLQRWPAVTTNAATGQGYTYDEGDKTRLRIVLAGAAKDWATPNAHERTQTPRAVDHGIQLANQVDDLSRQAQATEKDGPQSSPLALTLSRRYQSPRAGKKGVPGSSARHGGQPKGKRLNPRFVEWLMGFPINWTKV